LKENFDRFNYAIHKEKEMADFRRVVTALAVLALLTGFAVTANAQVPAFACTASAAVPPLLRAEGLTELTGDIVLNCTGGTAPAGGTVIGSVPNAGLANVTVFLGNTTVTSKIVDTNTNASEALLLVDEPAGLTSANLAPVASGCGGAACTVGGTTFSAFRGIVSNNSVTFIGVPVVAPGTNGARIFRITNVRANAAAIGAGTTGNLISSQLQAFVSISGSTSIPLNNPLQVIGFVQPGLAFSARNAANDGSLATAGVGLQQCVSVSRNLVQATLRYAEGFATAFKLQGTTAQDVPATVYNTESGFFNTSVAGGQASAATRLRATFNNIPTGTTVYVSITNLNAAAGNTALLTSAETGAFSAVSSTTTVPNGAGTVGIAPVTLTSGAGVAVWEVTDVSALALNTMDFGVYFATSANVSGNSPAVGTTGQVAGSFAPAYQPPTGTTASSTLPIPRFIASATPVNLVFFSICRTNILFPFVTNQGGFDTGLAIANTSKDPYTTTAQAGTCALNFFGDNAPSAVTSPSVAAGTVFTTVASTSAPNFQGYVIAVCNFQLAHGFAFISDVGARNLAMGYLGLIIPETPRTIPTAGESLNN
jgi:hypothetical protein